MLAELDEAIRRLLLQHGDLDPAEVDIRFEIPDREWAATISKPTINLYLYDIHENRQLRGTEWQTQRDGVNAAHIRRNPWRIDVAYLITAWTKAVEDEHRLLWHVLATLFRFPSIPGDLLNGALGEFEGDIPTSIGQPESTLRSPGEFWSALDNKLKPSLNYIVTLPLDTQYTRLAPLVFGARYGVEPMPSHPLPGTADISGVVRGADGRGLGAARVFFTGTNQKVTTDREGRYSFRGVPHGVHAVAVGILGERPQEFTLTVPADGYDLTLAAGQPLGASNGAPPAAAPPRPPDEPERRGGRGRRRSGE